MSEVASEAVTSADGVVQAVEHVVQEGVAEVRSVVAEAALQPAQTPVVTASSVDLVLGKIKSLIDGSGQTVPLWGEVTIVAKALHADVPAVVAKVKALLEFSEQPVKAFDEISALAVKLVPG